MNRCENAVFLESEAHCHKGLFEKRQLLTILFEALHVVHLARDPPFLSIGMLSWPSSFCACPVLGNPRRNYSRIAEDFVIVFIVSGLNFGGSRQLQARDVEGTDIRVEVVERSATRLDDGQKLIPHASRITLTVSV